MLMCFVRLGETSVTVFASAALLVALQHVVQSSSAPELHGDITATQDSFFTQIPWRYGDRGLLMGRGRN